MRRTFCHRARIQQDWGRFSHGLHHSQVLGACPHRALAATLLLVKPFSMMGLHPAIRPLQTHDAVHLSKAPQPSSNPAQHLQHAPSAGAAATQGGTSKPASGIAPASTATAAPGNLTSGGAGGESLTGATCEPSQKERRAQALHKFRQKKKNLCFTKKIRYESRKQLAQARPRIKGQFVRTQPSDVGPEAVAQLIAAGALLVPGAAGVPLTPAEAAAAMAEGRLDGGMITYMDEVRSLM